jgi:hypothetical protein
MSGRATLQGLAANGLIKVSAQYLAKSDQPTISDSLTGTRQSRMKSPVTGNRQTQPTRRDAIDPALSPSVYRFVSGTALTANNLAGWWRNSILDRYG